MTDAEGKYIQTSKSHLFPAEVTDMDFGTFVHLKDEAIIESDAHGGPRIAFIYAAHNWMDANVGPDRHTDEVCDQFNHCKDDIRDLSDGYCLLIADDLGSAWCFVGPRISEARLLPYVPEDER